jgi:hypothetical protein
VRLNQGEPWRHQVTEIPPVKAHITEHQFPAMVTQGGTSGVNEVGYHPHTHYDRGTMLGLIFFL